MAVDGRAGGSSRWYSMPRGGNDAREPQVASQGWKIRRGENDFTEGVWGWH